MEKNIGLIIIFYNDEHRLNSEAFTKLTNNLRSFYLCLVNNGSSDLTLNKLYDIKGLYKERVSVLNIKKHKPMKAALKAGIRLLKSNGDYQLIGFLDSMDILNFKNSINWDKVCSIDESDLKEIQVLIDKKNYYVRNLLRNVFSIKDLLSILEIE